VREHNCVAPVLINEPRERVEMRSIRNKQPVPLKRRFEVPDLKPVIRRRASEDRESLHVIRHLRFQIASDSDKVLVDTLSLLRVVRLAPLVQLLAHERHESPLSYLVHACVEVQTDHGRRRGFKLQEALQQLVRLCRFPGVSFLNLIRNICISIFHTRSPLVFRVSLASELRTELSADILNYRLSRLFS